MQMDGDMMSSGEGKQVCVTGASGYIASWLVNQLLLRGYTVNATVRDPDNVSSRHLFALQPAANHRLRLFKADLLDDGSFDDSINECDGVFHTASPCFFDSQNPREELLDPAIKGTINILSSCAKFPSVKRVVLTSSMTCMVWNNNPNLTPTDVIDEAWFSDPEYCRQQKRWYALSKTLAEETAWRYAKEKGIDLVSINPGYVIGPLLQPKINESCAKTYSNISYRVVHVKDVADAHIQALEIESANGRYCLVESVARVCETLEILRDLYPTLPLSNKCEKDTPSRLTCNVSKEKAKSLGIDFIPFRTTLKEMIHRFNENNFISF